MSWSFYELDAALSDAASSVFAEPALLRPRISTQYVERSADPDRPEKMTYGIFSVGPAQEDLRGQARGGQMSGTTKLSTAAAEFWELWLNLGDARHQAARFLASFFTSTPSLNLIPSMTFGN